MFLNHMVQRIHLVNYSSRMMGKSKIVLKEHIFIEKSNNSIQSMDHTCTVHGPIQNDKK
jgi:hypothetical protein